MLDQVRAFIVANPILAAALSSLWAAVVVDLTTFVKAKEPGDFFGQFSITVALWRYAQALVSGFLGNVVVAGAGTALGVAVAYWLATP